MATKNNTAAKTAKATKASAKKAPAVKAPNTKPKPKAKGKIAQIIALYAKGKTQRQIIDKGYAPGTVYRQVLIYRKQNKLA